MLKGVSPSRLWTERGDRVNAREEEGDQEEGHQEEGHEEEGHQEEGREEEVSRLGEAGGDEVALAPPSLSRLRETDSLVS